MQNYFMLCDISLAHGPLRGRHAIGGFGAELRTGAVFHKLSYQVSVSLLKPLKPHDAMIKSTFFSTPQFKYITSTYCAACNT